MNPGAWVEVVNGPTPLQKEEAKLASANAMTTKLEATIRQLTNEVNSKNAELAHDQSELAACMAQNAAITKNSANVNGIAEEQADNYVHWHEESIRLNQQNVALRKQVLDLSQNCHATNTIETQDQVHTFPSVAVGTAAAVFVLGGAATMIWKKQSAANAEESFVRI